MKKLGGPLNMTMSHFLLQYLVTPQSTISLSPSELLMGRRLRTIFNLLHSDLSDKIEQKQSKFPLPHQKVCIFSTGNKFMPINIQDHLCGHAD